MSDTKLLTVKELAFELRRSVNYVYSMRKAGFQMPGGTATLTEARAFLLVCKCPRSRAYTGDKRRSNG